MKRYVVWTLNLIVFTLGATGVEAATELKDVCGPKGTPPAGANAQVASLCRAAYLNGESWITNDNNSRVWAPVTAVCAFSCIAGVPGVCGGAAGSGDAQDSSNQQGFQGQTQTIQQGSTVQNGESGQGSAVSVGDPCSTAVSAGNKAYKADKSAGHDLESAKANGRTALTLSGGTPLFANADTGKKAAGVAGGEGSANGTDSGSNVGELCEKAAASGNVQDRFDCALASDPSFPKFIKDERFQQEFEKITGHPLQDIINADGAFVRNTLVPDGLENSFAQVKDKQSTLQFLGSVANLGKDMLKEIGDEHDRAWILGHLPAVVADQFLDVPGKRDETTLVASGAAQSSANGSPASVPGTRLTALSTKAALRAPASAELNPKTNIFEQVSRRYRLTMDRVERLDWALRYNQ